MKRGRHEDRKGSSDRQKEKREGGGEVSKREKSARRAEENREKERWREDRLLCQYKYGIPLLLYALYKSIEAVQLIVS